MRSKLKFFNQATLILIFALGPTLPCGAMDSPDTVELDGLSQLYEPVAFDHAAHVEMTGENCATCHHHTTGTPVEEQRCAKCHAQSGPSDQVACQECHAAKRFEAEYLQRLAADKSIYHVDKIGLKAAYHIRCMGCHQEMDAPNGCQDCHQRNDAGDKLFHAGTHAPTEQKRSSGGH